MNLGALYYANENFKPMYYLPKVYKDLILDYFRYPLNEQESFEKKQFFSRTPDNCSKKYNFFRHYLLDTRRVKEK